MRMMIIFLASCGIAMAQQDITVSGPDTSTAHNLCLSCSSVTVASPKQVWYEWSPQPDISTYELALATGTLVMILQFNFHDASHYIEELPPGAKRHFVRHEK